MANTAELQGFLEELGLGNINEAEAYIAGSAPPLRTNQSEVGQFAALGDRLGRGVGEAAAGLFRAFKDSRGEGDFNFSRAIRHNRDDAIARGAGLLGGGAELRSIKRLRDKIAKEDFGDTSTIEGRIKVAEFAAEQAQQEGNASVRSAAMAKLRALREEKLQEDKLKAQVTQEQNEAQKSSTPDIWLTGENTPRTGQFAKWTEGGKEIFGMEYFDENGQLQRARVGEYSFVPPTFGRSGTPETIGKAWGRNTSPQDDRLIRGLVNTGQESVRKMGRVLDTVNQLAVSGDADQVMSTAGDMISWTENAVRNISGVMKTIGTAVSGNVTDEAADPNRRDADGNEVGWQGLDYWTSPDGAVASDPNHAMWQIVQLPEDMKTNSAAAQNYRAQIMELMYMAARLAEPSNRGLSDNDIIAAAKKLGGNTANPQVMMRRFAEMLHDSAADLENKIDVYFGAVEFEDFPVPAGMTKREMFEKFIGGAALPKYRESLAELRGKYDFTVDPVTGRARFNSPIDSDLQPEEVRDPRLLDEIVVEETLSPSERRAADQAFLEEF